MIHKHFEYVTQVAHALARKRRIITLRPLSIMCPVNPIRRFGPSLQAGPTREEIRRFPRHVKSRQCLRSHVFPLRSTSACPFEAAARYSVYRATTQRVSPLRGCFSLGVPGSANTQHLDSHFYVVKSSTLPCLSHFRVSVLGHCPKFLCSVHHSIMICSLQ
jgi:hypothetical protein